MSLNGYSVADAVSKARGVSFPPWMQASRDQMQAYRDLIVLGVADMPRVRMPFTTDGGTKILRSVTPTKLPFPRMWIEGMRLPISFNDGRTRTFEDVGVLASATTNEDGSEVTELLLIVNAQEFSHPRLIWRGLIDTFPDGTFDNLGATAEFMDRADMDPHGMRAGMLSVTVQISHAIALMNCKNVSLVDAPLRVKPPSKKQRRKRTPALTFKTIKLPGGSSSGGDGTGEPGETARHIVRGNFATYTNENPLFGNITGTFWRPAHVRGKTKHGIVQKDYEVAS